MNKISQFYETELIHDSGLRFRSITIPRRNYQSTKLNPDPQYLAKELGITIVDAFEMGWIQRALITVLAFDSLDNNSNFDLSNWRKDSILFPKQFRDERRVPNDKLIRNMNGYYEFAEYLSMVSVIPFENSPLGADSLGNLLKIGGYGVGAYIGFVVGGTTPLLFITVPAGMVICGAAAGIGQGLEVGLKSKITKFLTSEHPDQ
ncbi:MAG: hypothetical protein COA96_08040 [SAR86 cluster bacterium]|uniref:Uncharacterized protein n=1 Tax=SAR86 cluster bacterium TaxID=2030880 RepID=A0A2A5B0T8_9GAMM|nr:MAG: hypothetical protein COA96_08040 [SAR86 cluster bacterium]